MKKIIQLVSMMFLSICIAQNTGGSVYDKTEIVDVSDATVQTLNQRANAFLKAKKFEPKPIGAIINSIGSFTVTYPSVKKGMQETGKVTFKISISIKEAKYRVILNTFAHEGIKGQATGGSLDADKPVCGDTQISNLAWNKIREQAKEQTDAFIAELKNNMANPTQAKPTNTMDF